MWSNNLLYIIFIAQIFFVSYYFPMRLVRQTFRILEKYSPEEYPKLYPVSKDVAVLKISNFKRFNLGIALVGVAIVIHGIVTQSEELLFVDSLVVILAYFMLQWIPLLMMEFSGLQYLKLMRMANTSPKRSAELKPRGLLDYVSMPALAFTIFMQLMFVAVFIYFIFNPFEGFGGVANLAGIAFADCFFVGILLWNIKGKKKNPYLAIEDRDKQIRQLVRVMVITSNLMIAFISLELVMSATGSRHLLDPFMSLYFLAIASVSYQAYRVEGIDFEVYREKSA
jgi:hypothetical protein